MCLDAGKNSRTRASFRWIGVKRSFLLVGSDSGVYTEIYRTETTYFGWDCAVPMFAVDEK